MAQVDRSGPLSVRGRPAAAESNRAAAGTSNDPHLTALAKLFPAEGVTALPLAMAIDPGTGSGLPGGAVEAAAQASPLGWLEIALVILIAVGCTILRWFATGGNRKAGDLSAAVVAAVSFLIYAAALLAFGPFIFESESATRLSMTILAIFWVALSPYIVRLTPPPAPTPAPGG